MLCFMDEFQLIARYFAPLAGEGALWLRDDAALLTPAPGCELVLTKDVLVAGVHFYPDDPAQAIAQKALRVNLSDLAAKGAEPLGYLMGLMLPGLPHEAWLRDFCSGLKQDQETYGITLLGGDTARTRGPLALSITAIGQVPAGAMLKRSGARVGDVVMVTGTIGDAALGLKEREGFLRERYLRPQPRLALGKALRGLATACMDVSDGLVQDAGHIAHASGVQLLLEPAAIPLSEEARTRAHWDAVAHGGDDYELLFATPPEQVATVQTFAAQAETAVTVIGRVVQGSGVMLSMPDGTMQPAAAHGWMHFRSA